MPRRFFLPPGSVREGVVTITGSDAHHIRRVLRLSPGDVIEVIDGKDGAFLVKLTSFEADEVCGVVERRLESKAPETTLSLFQGVPKGRKMDSLVRGAVEAGADSIVPVLMARSVPEIRGERAGKRADRWRRIAAEAAKQARRERPVPVSVPVSFREALDMLKEYDVVLVFWEGERERLPSDALKPGAGSVGAVVGPEGGLAEEELRALEEIGGIPVTMGESILRAETAGVVACAIIRYELIRLRRGR